MYNYNVIIYRDGQIIQPTWFNKIPVYRKGWNMDRDGQEHTIYKVNAKNLSDIVIYEEGAYYSPTFVDNNNIVAGWMKVEYKKKK